MMGLQARSRFFRPALQFAMAAALASGGIGSAAAHETGVFPVDLDENLLLVFADPLSGQGDAFAQWYDRHLVEFVEIPGVDAAQRFTISRQGTISEGLLDNLAMYTVSAETSAKLDQEVQTRNGDGRITRSTAVDYSTMFHMIYRPLAPEMLASDVSGTNPVPLGQGPASLHYLVVLSEPTTPEAEDEYNRWYDLQHLQDVLRVPGFVSAQRFIRIGGKYTMPRHLVIFKFRSAELAATNAEIGRRIRSGETVMSTAFGPAKGAIANPVGEVTR